MSTRLDGKRDRQVLAGVDRQHRDPQLGDERLDLERRLAEQRAAGGRAIQLVSNDVGHAIDLAAEQARTVWCYVMECRAHDGQWCLQTVSEIAHRIPVARDTIALTNEQRVQVCRNSAQLARIAVSQRLARAGFHGRDFLLESAHR